jgi:hypothetical protein
MFTTLLFALQAAAMGGPSTTTKSMPVRAEAAPGGSADVATATQTRATRAMRALVIDGKDDDDVWSRAQRITLFREFDPVEDGDPSLPTEARVAYDDKYFYAFVRAFDPHPDSIRSYLSRRDVKTPSDQLKIMIDSYHDRRTGYEFAVNPAGVKRDFIMSGDGNEDGSWDGVWDVATTIDDEGWTAEFRIPLSQMRFAAASEHTFGFAVWRDIARSNVRVSWPVYRRSKTGLVSQMGDVSGLEGLGSPRRLEVTPYTVAKDLTMSRANGSFGRMQVATAGADLKYGLTSNLTIDATVNPDFGQVEADPSVLNLTAFEQFYSERRPFFLEGAGIFSYNLNCNDGDCSGLFYSRRIGRSPQLSGFYGGAGTKQQTNIQAAAKLTGRLSNGLSIGILDAATERVSGPGNETVEPRANYFVARLNQDLRGGNSAVGLISTVTTRQLDSWSRDYLRSAAYTFGADARHRFGGNNYELKANLVGSRVNGSTDAIVSTQRSAVHNYQRPDGGVGVDSSRTSLDGYSGQISLSKTGGGGTRFNTYYKRTSAGFEVNDLGFLSRADEQSFGNWYQLRIVKPNATFRQAFLNFNQWTSWTAGGLATEAGGNINAHAQFLNQWWGHFGINANNVGRVYDDRASRGGPALPWLYNTSFWAGVETDGRWRFSPGLYVNGRFKDASGSWNYSVDQSTNFRLSGRLQGSVGASFFRQIRDAQWNGNYTYDGKTAYTFARLDQKQTSLTARMDFTATPTLSLQLYASPFMTSGKFTDWRELRDARAEKYEDRFKPFTREGDPGGFNFKQFRSNTVIRWEYRPGSTLFLVWAQGRTQDGINAGSFNAGRDAQDLFRSQPDNSFLIKTAYWFNW